MYSSLHISSGKFPNDLFLKKILFYPPKIPNDLFCHCKSSLSSMHILSHHCTFCASLHVKTSPPCLGALRLCPLQGGGEGGQARVDACGRGRGSSPMWTSTQKIK